MAGIIPSLFGPTPEELMSLRKKEQNQAITQAGQVYGPRGATGAALGTLLAGGVNKLFGLEDPEIKKAADVYNILKTTQQGLGSDATDPTKLYPALQANFANAGYGDIAEKVSTEGATKILDWNTKQATIKQKAFDLENDQNAKAAILKVQETAATENRVPTNEEIITAVSPFMSADKLAPLLQTSADKAAYRDTMKYEIDKRYEQKKQDGIDRKADKLFFANLAFEHQTQLKELEAKLNPKGSASSVYERGYANNLVTSYAELVPATTNLNILTQGGTSPITAGIFTGIKGTGVLSSTGAVLGTTITSAESGQYESIMLPVIQNIGTIQNAGRRTTISQLDNLKNALIAKPGQQYVVQVQKMGELRQIAEAAADAAMTNPALSEDQKAAVKGNLEKVKQAIPFTGADVAKYSIYAKKNPTVQFKDWLKVNGSDKEAFGGNKAPQAAIDDLKSNPALKDAFKAKYGYLPEGS
jgi:hypothetical protein